MEISDEQVQLYKMINDLDAERHADYIEFCAERKELYHIIKMLFEHLQKLGLRLNYKGHNQHILDLMKSIHDNPLIGNS